MPASLIFFVITAVVFVLQLIPFFGIFLMMLLAPFWSVLLVNFGFIGVGIEVALGRVALSWILLPVAWFGGYAIAAYQSNAVVGELRAEHAAAAQAITLPFNAAREQIVVDVTRSEGSGSNLTTGLAQGFDLGGPIFQVSRISRNQRYIALRMAPVEQCLQLQAAAQSGGNHFFNIQTRFGKARTGGEFCVYSQPENPGMSQTTISVIARKAERAGIPLKISEIVVKTASGLEARASSMIAYPLARLPLPVIGCALISSGPSWSCTVQFWRPNALIGEKLENVAVDWVGKTLDLKRNAVGAAIQKEKDEQATPRGQALVALDALDRFLAGRIDYRDKSLRNLLALNPYPELWRDRIDKIAETIVSSRETNRPLLIPESVSALFSTIPDPDFRRLAPRMIAALASKPNGGCGYLMNPTHIRLGDLGAGAMPAIQAAIGKMGGEVCPEILLMMCRAGASAASQAVAVHATMQKSQRGKETHLLAHNALLRMGRRDLAMADPPSGDPKLDAPYNKARAEMNANSAPAVCGLGEGVGGIPAWLQALRT